MYSQDVEYFSQVKKNRLDMEDCEMLIDLYTDSVRVMVIDYATSKKHYITTLIKD